MTIPLLILISIFLVIYVFLPRAMWKYYFADSNHFGVVFGLMLIIVAVWTAITGAIPWYFMLGFTMMDPISYTMTAYQRVQYESNRTKNVK
jgi:hypothetical protein